MTQNTTLDYYNQNAQSYFNRTRNEHPLQALQAFTEQVSPGGRILDAGCGSGRDFRFFHQKKFTVEGFDGSSELLKLAQADPIPTECRLWVADFMFLSLKKEFYDGIWAHDVLGHFHPDGCRRIVAGFFQSLRPGGILFASFEEGSGAYEDRTDNPLGPARQLYRYELNDTASLLRQHGFQWISQGRNLNSSLQFGYLAKRI